MKAPQAPSRAADEGYDPYMLLSIITILGEAPDDSYGYCLSPLLDTISAPEIHHNLRRPVQSATAISQDHFLPNQVATDGVLSLLRGGLTQGGESPTAPTLEPTTCEMKTGNMSDRFVRVASAQGGE